MFIIASLLPDPPLFISFYGNIFFKTTYNYCIIVSVRPYQSGCIGQYVSLLGSLLFTYSSVIF